MQQLQIMPQSHTFYSARCGVLWSTRLSVCPWTYPWNRWTDLRAILCADPMWLWLGPPPWHCPRLCTSGFMDDVTFGRNGHDAKRWRLHTVMVINDMAIPGQSLMSMNACFSLWQKWVYQTDQHHTSHPFNFFDIRALWRSVLSARVPERQKINNGGLDQYGPEHFEV